MKKFEIGPLQKKWIQSLKEHPERQRKEHLGSGTPENYGACCLGELHILGCEFLGKPSPFKDGNAIFDGPGNSGTLERSYMNYGLRDSAGGFKKDVINVEKGRSFISLAGMNDEGYTWPEIAEYIEQNPSNVFTKPV